MVFPDHRAAIRSGLPTADVPMIGVAIAARFYFLDVLCPGCRQVKQVDLRTLNRHERTTLHGLIPKLSCRSCQPNPPFARLLPLSQHEWVSKNRPAFLAHLLHPGLLLTASPHSRAHASGRTWSRSRDLVRLLGQRLVVEGLRPVGSSPGLIWSCQQATF
jgi:hypothetical protein